MATSIMTTLAPLFIETADGPMLTNRLSRPTINVPDLIPTSSSMRTYPIISVDFPGALSCTIYVVMERARLPSCIQGFFAFGA